MTAPRFSNLSAAALSTPDGLRHTEFDTRSNLCPNPGTGGGQP
jgi:hypothetical protein